MQLERRSALLGAGSGGAAPQPRAGPAPPNPPVDPPGSGSLCSLPGAPPPTPRLSLARVQASPRAFDSPPSSPLSPTVCLSSSLGPGPGRLPPSTRLCVLCRPAHRCVFCASEEWTSGPQARPGSSIPGGGGSGGGPWGRQREDAEGGGRGCGLSLEPLTGPLSPSARDGG